MVTEKDLIKTNISISYQISPVRNIVCDLSQIIGNSVEDLLLAFYPSLICKKANTVITELVNNVLENSKNEESGIDVELKINADKLTVKVMNEVTFDQFERVKSHVENIFLQESARDLLKETLKERRNKRFKGGLGLIRLVAENKFNIQINYLNNKYLVVESQIELGGLV